MTVTTEDYLIPDEIARHAVLPASYADETGKTYPAYEWLRKNNPLGLARLDNFDPLWLVTKHADLIEVERQPDLFTSGVLNPILQLVEESLRWVSPVKHFMRAASRDTTLRGRQIKAGDRLMLLYASANRDEDVFPHPDQFDIKRDLRHVAFGVGPHACVGMHVARLEMKVLFEELLPRIQRIELTGAPRWLKTNFVGGLRSMPVKLIKA